MEKEVIVKMVFAEDDTVNQQTYFDIINALNEKLLPVNEITVNGITIFNNIDGFINKGEN